MRVRTLDLGHSSILAVDIGSTNSVILGKSSCLMSSVVAAPLCQRNILGVRILSLQLRTGYEHHAPENSPHEPL